MKRIILLAAALLIIPVLPVLDAEEYIDWEGFPPMFNIQDMVEYNGMVYCACKGGLYRYDPAAEEYTLYYKNHGLLGNNVRAVAATSEFLFLGFKDFGLVRFDPQTEEYKKILFPEYTASDPPIEINSIFVYNDSILYIGHSKGVDKINIFTKELRTFTNLGKNIDEQTPVNDVKVIKDRIWVCTDHGLAVADIDNPDLEFESNWENYTYGTSRFNCVEYIVDRWQSVIFIGTKDDGIVFFNEELNKIHPTAVTKGAIYDMALALGLPWAASDMGLYRKYSTLWKFHESDYRNLRAFVGGSDSALWVGTQGDGLQVYTFQRYQPVTPVSGPRNSKFHNIDIADGNVVWISTAYRDQNIEARLLRFDNGIWTEYTEDDGVHMHTVDAVVDDSGTIWLASWGKGLFVLNDDGTPDKENDKLEEIDADRNFIRPTVKDWYFVCSDLDKDKHGNIWIVNHQANETSSGAIVVDGYPVTKYKTYSPQEDGLVSAEIYNMDVDEDGWVWLGTSNDGLMAVFVGEDPFDKTDTYVKNLNLVDGLLGMTITAVKHDLDGDIWVGTKGGLNRVKKLSEKRLKVDDMNALLSGKAIEVSCIEVDDSNNKWVGTSGDGLFKLDPGNELAANYTTENSGIFSDTIFSLKYDRQNDVLWIGTDTGLNRFYVSGVEVEEKDADIHIYPNPLEIWGTNSFATFDNLKKNTSVMIYNFGGDIVNELIADNGGNAGGASALWYGLNFKGETVASGVYFFVGTDQNGFQFKDKMVVIRR